MSTNEVETEMDDQKAVRANYDHFLTTILQILQRKKLHERRCNIFTTNYDACFAQAADRSLAKGTVDFILNDGSRGFKNKFLQAKNFNSAIYETGLFNQHRVDIPQINLIHLHGSVYWKKFGDGIQIDYAQKKPEIELTEQTQSVVASFSESLLKQVEMSSLPTVSLATNEKDHFWQSYEQLPIINPTKRKFYETVFEEHYYQMLRLLSYELEKPNSVLITFGFSFSDEHILNLVKRSLSNPTVMVYVCCFNDEEHQRQKSNFQAFPNVKCVVMKEGVMTFSKFNDAVFTLSSVLAKSDPKEVLNSEISL
jgi:SIR2-like domain